MLVSEAEDPVERNGFTTVCCVKKEHAYGRKSFNASVEAVNVRPVAEANEQLKK